MTRSKAAPAGPTLFDAAGGSASPLAERVRPRALGDVVGHQRLLGEGRALAEAIDSGELPSMILWGPPGCGKTTLARLAASRSDARFVPFSAVLGGVAQVRAIVAEAEEHRAAGRATVLFVDEIHRFNKAQQDAFLPHVERGTIVLIGATTENPSFCLNAPLLSRCIVHRLEPLADDDVQAVLRRALALDARLQDLLVEPDALAWMARLADGDARRALSLLEAAAAFVRQRGDDALTTELLELVQADRTLRYDRAGEEHYNIVSAFIKSMRGSDPDAAVYWLMRMLEAGDDPLFLCRRMIIFASEDIGNADPRALAVAVDADRAFRRVGMPEGHYLLAQAATYLASAPKSNAAGVAWQRAREAIARHGALPVPMKLRNAPTPLMRQEGYGQGYRYPHDEGGVARGETYLPDELVGTRFYEPKDSGLETAIAARLERIRSGKS